MVEIESPLFHRLIREKSLRHPTARNFDEAEWATAFDHLEAPTVRDEQLATAAVHYGREIRSLRQTFESNLFKDLDRRTAILLSIGVANHNFVALRQKGRKLARNSVRDGVVHLGLVGRTPIPSSFPGNETSGDAGTAIIVDTLPHCLERANSLTGPLSNTTAMSATGAKLFVTMSIEHSLRDLWQQILWDGWALRRGDGRLRHDPADRELAVLWNAWLWRQEMLLSQGAGVDALFENTRVSANKNIEPVISPTVIGIGGSSKADRRFRFGTVSGREPGQNWHRAEATIVNDSYLEPFMDSPLPVFSYLLSCRDLQRAWCVLRDCAWVLAARSKESRMRDVEEVEASSLLIGRAELERAITHCAKLDADATRRILDFLVCDIENAGRMFTKGLWASPMVSIDEGKNVALTLAPIAIGSTIRRIEEWLDRGGLSDRLSEARRGLKYEAWVRQEIRGGLSDNKILQNTRCAEASINRDRGVVNRSIC